MTKRDDSDLSYDEVVKIWDRAEPVELVPPPSTLRFQQGSSAQAATLSLTVQPEPARTASDYTLELTEVA